MMKFLNTIKIFLLLTALLTSASNLSAQNKFIRVYDLSGHKIAKGKIVEITDSTIQLKKYILSIKNIGYIRTKHSALNNIGWGTLIGFATLTTVGTILSNQDKNNELAGIPQVLGVVYGPIIGFTVGALTIPFKKSIKYEINGDLNKWKSFKQEIEQ